MRKKTNQVEFPIIISGKAHWIVLDSYSEWQGFYEHWKKPRPDETMIADIAAPIAGVKRMIVRYDSIDAVGIPKQERV